MGTALSVRGFLGASVLIAFSCATARASPVATTALEVHAALDDTTYLPGQPIYLLVSARNVSDTTFHDLGHISSPGFLSFQLFRGRLRITDHYIERNASIIVDNGRDLSPGVRVCAVHNLLNGFGKSVGIDMPFGSRYEGLPVLPSGRYRLTVQFRSHVKWSGYEDWLNVAELNFRVLPSSAISPLNERALHRISHMYGRRYVAPTAGDWNEIVKQGLDRSRYVGPLLSRFMPDGAKDRIDELALRMMRSGASAITVAGVLVHPVGDYARTAPREGRAWIRKAQPAFQDSTLQCLFSTWDEVLERSDWIHRTGE